MSTWPPAGSVRTHGRGSVPPVRRCLRALRAPRTGRRWVAAGLVAATAAAVTAAPAAATVGDVQPTAADTPPTTARLVVNGLQAVVGPAEGDAVPASEEDQGLPSTFSARVLVENLTDEPLDDLRLVLTVHERVTTRSDLRLALDPTTTQGLGAVAHRELLPIDRLPPGGIAQVEAAVDATGTGLVHPDNDVALHPVSFAVDQGVSVLDEVRTAAVGVARPVSRPLATVMLAPLDGPTTTPTTSGAADTASLLPGGRLDRILRALEAAPAGTATMAPAAHAVEDLQRLVDSAQPGATDMLARLRAVVDERAAGLVSTPYALADVPALAAGSSTEDLAAAAIVAGRQRLLRLLGQTPDAAHLLVSSQTPSSLDLAPSDVLVMPWDGSVGPDLEATPNADIPPALRVARSESGRALDVLVADPWITHDLAQATGAHGWEVDAHRAVVESAMTFAQAPSREGRALAVLPPVGWDAPGRLASELYTRLAAAPWLRSTDPVTAASGGLSASWEPAAGVSAERTALLGRIGALQDRLEGLTSAVTDIDERPAVVSRGDDLLRAASVWPQAPPPDQGQRILAALEEDIDAAIGEVVVPADSAVTLASERGVIPVTVQHPEGVPMDVVVEVATQGRLTFQDGTTRAVRLDEGGTATVSFEATALGRGTFPLRVTVRTPTGDVVLAREILEVRASAVSRPALLVIGGVVLLLLLLGRLRRSEHPQLEVVR